MRAAIYTRVSSDPKQRWKSVGEQEAECRNVAAARGWDVVNVFSDNHRSASRYAKKERPEFERLKKFITDGGCDVLLTWEGSRGQRDLEVFVQLRKLLEANGVLWSYEGDVLDMSKPRDRKRAAEDAVDAEYEVDRTRERILRSTRASAAAGRPHGRRLFGYQRVYDPATGGMVGQEPHETEADVVRGIFTSYLSGSGIRTIALDLTRRSITTGTGAVWKDVQVKRVLTNPAYIAKRVHQGQVVGDATWPALVDDETFTRAQARLESKRGSQTRQTGNANLLSGVARCGVCGGKMGRSHDRKKRSVYACKAKFCTTRDLVKLDAYVTATVLHRLAQPDVADAIAGDDPTPESVAAATEAATLRARLDDAIAAFTRGELSAATLARVELEIVPRITDAEARVRRAAVPLDVDVPRVGLDGWWDGMSREHRREIVGALISAVVVSKTPPEQRGRRDFDPSFVQIEWRRAP